MSSRAKTLLGTVLLAAVVGVAAGSAAAATIPVTSELGLRVHPCTQGRHKVAALCGTFGVFENRAAHSGKVIQLALAVLKAAHPSRDAIALIEGGPGLGAVADAAAIADAQDPVLAPFKNDYDVVFVDNRGMGSSNPTRCNIAPYGDMPAYFLQIWPSSILSACYRRYSATSDPSAYNTNNAVDDLDDVRAALGYRKLLLYGGSYGSFFSFVYIRRHPEQVRLAVLEGILAPHFEPLPGAPDAAQTAIDDLARKCSNDPSCSRHFPNFMLQFQAVLRRFQNGPVSISVQNGRTKKLETVRLSKEVLVDRIRENLYIPQTAAYLPYAVDRAYHFDYVPIGRMIDLWSQFIGRAQDAGTNLAYRCADLDPFISESELRAAAVTSFAGDLRVQAERHACDIWKVDPMPASFNEPVQSATPILMVSGTDDPVTPPKYAQAALRYLSNGTLVLVKGAGHGVDTECTNRLMIAFIRNGSAKGIDATSCSAAFKTPRFATSMSGWDDFE